MKCRLMEQELCSQSKWNVIYELYLNKFSATFICMMKLKNIPWYNALISIR